MQAYIIPSEDVSKLWKYLEPHFQAGVNAGRGYFTVRDHYDDVVNGRSILWSFWSDDCRSCIGAALFDLSLIGMMPVLVCRMAAGTDMGELLQSLQPVEEMAKRLGAQRIIFDGRKGFSKVLPGDYRVVAWVFEKDLTDVGRTDDLAIQPDNEGGHEECLPDLRPES